MGRVVLRFDHNLSTPSAKLLALKRPVYEWSDSYSYFSCTKHHKTPRTTGAPVSVLSSVVTSSCFLYRPYNLPTSTWLAKH
jgi:hypothetical protein